jgi:hypothetical protein
LVLGHNGLGAALPLLASRISWASPESTSRSLSLRSPTKKRGVGVASKKAFDALSSFDITNFISG